MLQQPAAAAPDAYLDPTSLLYGLRDRAFVGATPPCDMRLDMSLNELIAKLAVAQKRSADTVAMGAWSDDKEARKGCWGAQGVCASLLVPTLYACALAADPGARPPSPEFLEAENGDWLPSLESAEVPLTPSDFGCEAAIWELLAVHRRLVLKPTCGSNSAGVVLLSLHDDPLCTPKASGSPRGPRRSAALPAGSVWAYAPNKNELVLAEAVSCLARHEWFARCVTANARLGGCGARFMVEPAAAHDQVSIHVYLSIFFSIYLSICLSIYLSVYLSIYIYVYIYIYIYIGLGVNPYVIIITLPCIYSLCSHYNCVYIYLNDRSLSNYVCT